MAGKEAAAEAPTGGERGEKSKYLTHAEGGVLDTSEGYEQLTEGAPEIGVYTIVGGYLDDEGKLHNQVQLRAMSGHEEDLLSNDAVPFFVRMTPAGALEIALLALTAALLGLYVAIRRPACSVKGATAGGVLGFVGVACPVCNKLLVLLVGSELLLTYFEPVRVFVAAAGVVILALAIAREWALQRMAAVEAGPVD